MATPKTAWSAGDVTPSYATLANLGLPGVRHVVDSKAPIWQRVAWAAAIVACLALAAWQINERIKFLRDSSVSVDVKVIPNAALEFPYFTLCQRNRTNDPFLRKILTRVARQRYGNLSLFSELDECDLMDFRNWTVKEGWFAMNKNLQLMLFKRATADVLSPSIPAKIKFLPSFYGPCHTFYPEKFPIRTLSAELRYKMIRKDLKKETRLWIYSILLHDEPTVTDIELAMADDLPTGSNVVHLLEVNQFTYLNTTQNPCMDTHNYTLCRRRCLNKAVIEAANCRMPYMNLNMSDVKEIHLPWCATPAECRQAVNSTRAVYTAHDWKTCKCPRQCKKIVYGGTRTIEPTVYDVQNVAYLRVGVQSTRVTLAEEYYSYTVVSFLCDVGGTLGLFLGLCLLTVIEIMEGLFWSINQALQKRRKESKTTNVKS